MTPSTLLIMLLAFGALTPEVKPPPPLNSEGVLTSPTRYNGKVITLSGWFRTGRETSTIQSHGGVETNVDKIIWVDDIDSVTAFEELFRRKERSSKTEPMTAQEKKVYRRLMGKNWPCPVPLTARGEFRTSATTPFGHMGGYKNRIITLQGSRDWQTGALSN